MTKYNVKHYCGHSETHELLGPHERREDRINYLGSRDCQSCYIAKLSEGLPALKGSKRQNIWGAKLRSDMVKKVDGLQQRILGAIGPDAPASLQPALTAAVERLKSEDRASYFIDNRDKSAGDLLMTANPEIKTMLSIPKFGPVKLL